MSRLLIAIAIFVTAIVGVAAKAQNSRPIASSPYLFVWAGDADRNESDFLAVIDVRPKSKRYGRVITTLPISHVVQVWRLTDLKLLKSIYLPGAEGVDPAEPRLLSDGRTVLVSTFTCGLYRITNLESENPGAEFIHSFGGKNCALPVVAGKFWIQTVPASRALISLDISNPSKPVEASRLVFGESDKPHWIALEPNGRRIVVSGGSGTLKSRVLIARIDSQTGKLSLDGAFREKAAKEAGINFERELWKHGKSGRAIPHGAVFSRP